MQILFLLLVAVVQGWEHDDERDLSGCDVVIDGHVFNLKNLTRDTDEEDDYLITYNNGKGNVSLDFNFCQYTQRKCPDKENDYANFINENNTCYHLSNDEIDQVYIDVQDLSRPDYGLVIHFKMGDYCNSTNDYELVLQLNCEEGRNVPLYQVDSSSITYPCTQKVVMYTSHACPVISIWELWYFFEDYDYLFGLIFIIYGLFLVSVGGRFYKITFFVSTMLVFCFAFMLTLFTTLYPSYSPEWVAWLTIIAGLIIGASFGYGAARWPYIGVFILGVIVGCTLGAFIYGIGFYEFSDNHPHLVLWCTMAGFGAVVAIISIILFDYAVIIFSGLIGGYILIRGISFYSGNYPNEFQIFEDIRNNSLDQICWQFWVYLSFMLLITTASIIVQIILKNKFKDKYSYRQYNFSYRRI